MDWCVCASVCVSVAMCIMLLLLLSWLLLLPQHFLAPPFCCECVVALCDMAQCGISCEGKETSKEGVSSNEREREGGG